MQLVRVSRTKKITKDIFYEKYIRTLGFNGIYKPKEPFYKFRYFTHILLSANRKEQLYKKVDDFRELHKWHRCTLKLISV
jgi:hypothetical protein